MNGRITLKDFERQSINQQTNIVTCERLQRLTNQKELEYLRKYHPNFQSTLSNKIYICSTSMRANEPL
jgi:hypothetical protein